MPPSSPNASRIASTSAADPRPAPGRAIKRLAIAASAVASLEAAVFYLYWWARVIAGGAQGPDFFSFYAAARLFLQRGGAHVYVLAEQKAFQDQVTGGAQVVLPYIHPPWYTLAIAPLGLVSYPVAYDAMAAINLVLAAIALVLLTRINGIASGREVAIAGVLMAGFFPLFVTLVQGQSDLVMLAALAGCFAAWASRRDAAAGALAALAMIKPQLLLIVPILFVVRRSWSAAGAFAVTAALLGLASLVAFGPSGIRDYSGIVVPWLGGGQANWPITGQSVYSLRGFLEPLPGGRELALAALVVLDAAAVALLALRHEDRRADLALAVAVSIALSPYQNLHDLLLLVVPAFWLVTTGGIAAGVLVALAAVAIDLTLIVGPLPAALAVLALALYTSTKSRFRQAR